MTTWTTIVAQPSNVAMDVHLDWPGITEADLAAIAEAVDTFVYTLCEACGYDIDGHIVVPGPLGHPHLYCESGEG